MLGGADTAAAPKITWMNDSIRPLMEEERLAQSKSNPRMWYISKYTPVIFNTCGKTIELGLRDDGVCVWRIAP